MGCLFLIMSSTSFAKVDLSKVQISGTMLGLYNTFDPGVSQFDFATNLDFSYQITDRLKGFIQLQGGTGDGSLGFQGAELVVTDINLEYELSSYDSVFTLGSYDTPFGQGTYHLTNNADTFSQSFVMNNLVYSSLAGPVGTLNTLGIKWEKQWTGFSSIASLSNGTGESSINEGRTFESLLQLYTDQVIPGVLLSATYLDSNDRPDASNSANTSFEADMRASIVDLRYDFQDHHHISSHIGQMDLSDANASTEDEVRFYGVEYGFDNGDYFVGLRYSTWMPEDNNGDGQGVSTVLLSPGLSNTVSVDTSVNRWQIAAGLYLDDDLRMIFELAQDQYDGADDVNGFLMGLNARF